jgi:hypothetical protein
LVSDLVRANALGERVAAQLRALVLAQGGVIAQAAELPSSG